MNQSTAIVLLNFNSQFFLEKFLTTLVLHTPSWANIYIIDNNSSDKSKAYVAKNFSQIKWIQLKCNLGFAGGYAEGLKQIKEKYWVLLNSDVEVTKNWLPPLIDHLNNDDSLAAIQPKIKSYKQKEYFEHAGASGGYIDFLGYPFCRGRLFDYVEEDIGQYDTFKSCFWVSGACMAIKKEAYEAAGGFDPRFFVHMEEIDLCWRLNRLGYNIACEPKSTIYHVGGGSLPYESPKKFYYNFRNNLILLHKNLPLNIVPLILTLRCILDWIAAFREILNGKPKNTLAIGKAWLDYLIGITKWRKNFNHTSNQKIKLIYKRPIIVEFFLLNKKRYSSLPYENSDSRS